MKDIVPGTLQRLRAADVIRMAGLNAASLGQEYARAGAIHEPQRQDAQLSGIVEIPRVSTNLLPAQDEEPDRTELRRFAVEVEVQSANTWTSHCSCNADSMLLCAHAAALMYRWLSHPTEFAPPATSPVANMAQQQGGTIPMQQAKSTPTEFAEDAVLPTLASKPIVAPPGSAITWDLLEILTQLGLGELRSITRTYDIATNGMSKQRIAEVIADVLRKPEVVRRVATTLEKPQRQLLAAITLAGGLVTDEDLYGLFERFALGPTEQLQRVLLTLQSKALLFRTTLHSAGQSRIGLNNALLDISWYVPSEVRTALRVTVPTTVFNTEQNLSAREERPLVQLAQPYRILADLLLVARALDGFVLRREEDWQERPGRSSETAGFSRMQSAASDGSVAIPPPSDLPTAALFSAVQKKIPHAPETLRFALRLLKLADILQKDESGTAQLRVLPNIAQLFLGAKRAEVARDLFELWLTQSSYTELFDLQEEGLRLRCRATALNFPVLRSGELDSENRDARQTLINLLAQVPLHQWVNYSAFARFVYRLNPVFLQRKQRQFSTPHWWIEQESGQPLHPSQLNDWLHAEFYYLARLLRGPLHWWGACDVASGHDGRIVAFRLTAIAGWLFAGMPTAVENASSAPASAADALEIVDDEVVSVSCDAQSWPVVALLERFAQTEEVQQGRLYYRLTPGALSAALKHGSRPDALLDVLRSLARRTLQTVQPDNALVRMLERLERWIASYGRVRIYTGVTLLETVDTVVMHELTATTNVNEQIVQTLNPTLHILKQSGAEPILEELKRRGQTPLLHNRDEYAPE
ncbi:MAG TPA: hypothetical protein VHZ51_04205 [Ktedonobacteraceae bacterium]|nr:hypothetical protein [Ktedonobacteraceae bacterium]